MPQQINLCTPVLLTQRRYFSARMMLYSLAAFVLVGGGLAIYGVWSLHSTTRALQATLDRQVPELASLRIAVAGYQLTGPSGEALIQQLTATRAHLVERQKALYDSRRGLMPPGQGNSARLQLVARTIPAQAWVTEVRADESVLELRGFTREPASLNDWVAKLAQSPLLSGQQLARVKVERVVAPAAAGSALWSFTLVSALTVVARSPGVGPSSGVKP